MHSPIYLDHNATTPILPEVAEAVREASLQHSANPDSQHEAGRQARRALEDARERIGELLGAQMGGMQADQLIFTSGGTEANNLAVAGIAASGAPAHLVTSAVEHPCVAEACDRLAVAGWNVDLAQPSSTGLVSAEEISRRLSERTRFVALMLANNETGVMQPVGKVAKLCAERNVLIHTDASQAVGKIPVHFSQLGVHSLACTAHKFNGPLGIGALALKHGLKLPPLLVGGHQQSGVRPGTQTVALAIGMKVALEISQEKLGQESKRLTALRDEFERQITLALPTTTVLGREAQRLPNTSNIAFAGADRQALVMALDMAGIPCSTGSACASGSSEPSPTLLAMGLEKPQIDGSIRFSFGAQNTAAEMAEAAGRIIKVCKQLGLVINA